MKTTTMTTTAMTTLTTTKVRGHTSVRECNMRPREPIEIDDGIDDDAKRKYHEEAEMTKYARGYAAGQREAWEAWQERGEDIQKIKGGMDEATLHARAASAYNK